MNALGFLGAARGRFGEDAGNSMIFIGKHGAEARFEQARFGGSSVSVGLMERSKKTASKSSNYSASI